jgi:hypothetical protein
MTLYEINEAMLNCINEDGEVDVEQLKQLQLEKSDKIENIALWIKNLKADVSAYDNEIKSLQERKERDKNKAESLKNYLDLILDGEKFKTARVECSFRHSKKVNIIDESKIPRKYFRIKKEVSKTDIADAIKDGIKIKGAELVESRSLQIK